MTIIGLAKEIKICEFRVALSPYGVQTLTTSGRTVLVERDAGISVGFDNASYSSCGAKIVSRSDLFSQSDIIVKVKEPQQSEIDLLRQGQVIFSYLHLAPDPVQARGLIAKKVAAIAFETITDEDGSLPLLTSMSQAAGRLAVQHGAYFLSKPNGSGILLSGLPGSERGKVLIIGGGVVGTSAAMMAVGYGSSVVILDRSMKRLRHLEEIFGNHATMLYSHHSMIEKHIADSDLVIGSVLTPGATAQKVITRSMLSRMRHGSVLADVSIDQGGCFETSRATTHDDPIYSVDGILHYCVTNIPSAAARTSSMTLEASILPYVAELSSDGPIQAMLHNKHLRNGLNIFHGKVTHSAVANALGYQYYDAEQAMLEIAGTRYGQQIKL